MRVLHVIPSLSPRHGGPSKALPVMAQGLIEAGVEVDVVTTDDDGPGQRLTAMPLGEWAPRDGWRVMHFAKQTEFYKVSWPLWSWLLRHARDYDLIHVHAVFSFSTLAAGWAARLAGVPFVVRPLGTLNAWGMKNRRRWVKSLSFRLLDKPVLDRAAAVHFTSEQEAEEAFSLKLRARAALSPLGMDLVPFTQLPPAADFAKLWPETQGRTLILYLSRLDPIKKLDHLIAATSRIRSQHPDALLVIAGAGEKELERALRQQVQDLGMTDSVLWTGMLDHTAKLAAFSAATLFVLPSLSENFGIALLEAMAAGLPCIASSGVALAHQVPGAVMMVPPNVDALAEAIHDLLIDLDRRQSLAKEARRRAFADFSAEARGLAVRQLYEDILAGAPFTAQLSSPTPPSL